MQSTAAAAGTMSQRRSAARMSSIMTGRAVARPVLIRPVTARRGVEPGVEEPGHRQPGLVAKGGRAALAEIGGRAGGDQVAGEVEEPPQAVHPAGPHGQVPLPGQEPGQGILFQVGAGRDARGGTGKGVAAGPVGPVRDGPRVLDAAAGPEEDRPRAPRAEA